MRKAEDDLGKTIRNATEKQGTPTLDEGVSDATEKIVSKAERARSTD